MHNMTLRSLLEDRASNAFRTDGVADTQVDVYEIDLRLAAMQRALVAHDALTRVLCQVDVPVGELPGKLLDAIAKAEGLSVISSKEVKQLKWINREANKAKHDRPLPF